MYNIGYINLANEHNQKLKDLFKDSNYAIKQLKPTDSDCFKNQNVLLIEDKETSDLSFICKLLIEAKKYPRVLVYIISPLQKLEKSIKDVYFQLGVNGIKDASLEWEEFSFVIKNIIEKLGQTSSSTVRENDYPETITQGTIQLEPNNLSIFVDKHEILLTKLEYRIVELLYTSVGKTVSYEQISKKVWTDYSEEKKYRVANMVFHIRRKIEQTNHSSNCIKTIRSKGYMLTI